MKPEGSACLFIGGPKHGQWQAVAHDAKIVEVPSCGAQYIGVGKFRPDDYLSPFHIETYKRTPISLGEQREDAFNGVRVWINVNVNVTVYVHETILTIEEAAAYYRKLRPGSFRDAAERTFVRMKLTNDR